MSFELDSGRVSFGAPVRRPAGLRHGGLEPLLEGLWRVVADAPGATPLKRNMFVYRLPTGDLLLYSVIAMNELGMQALESLGRPAVMVVPHPRHTHDARFYKQRYPDLLVYGARDAQDKLRDLRFNGTPEEALGQHGIRAWAVPGLRVTEEVLELPAAGGRALLFTDLVNQNEPNAGFFARLLGAPDGAGVARVLKWTQIRDVERVRAFLRRMAEVPDLRLVAGCHGAVVTRGCREWLTHAAATL